MEELRASLEASLEDDRANETDADAKYNSLLGEIRTTISDITNELSAAREELR